MSDHLLSERLPYQAFVDRPRLSAPGRVLVWFIVNVEHWTIARQMPRSVLVPPMGQALMPDLPNWSWHEYGMRSGFWRIYEALGSRGIVPTLAVNGIVCESYPRVAGAARDAGWEFMGHGWEQLPMHKVEHEAHAIERTIKTLSDFTGRPVRGWEGPGLTETDDTLDLLSAAGIDYVADWVVDDQPSWLHARPRPVLAMPYTVEINDIPVHLIQNHPSDELCRRGIAQLERLWQEGAANPRVMAVSVHPYITGVPHRIAAFERLVDAILSKPDVLVQTGAQITDWYTAQVAPPEQR